MVMVPVSALKTGERLSEEVRTELGNVLMEKGKVIGSKEVDVLKAFLVKVVSVEGNPGENEQEASAELPVAHFSNQTALLYKEYDALYQMLKKAFHVIRIGTDKLPILDIRTQLEKLLEHIDLYNPLTFTPRRTGVDDYLVHNGIMIGLSAYQLARWQGIPRKDWIPLVLSGILHDIGTTRVEETIVQKPGKLSQAEFEELKKHTVIGYNILKNIAGINEGVKLCALQHHERLDGSGYPLGVSGDKIHIYARLIAVIDVFHAMTTSRRYKNASSPYLVLEELMKEAFGRLDPAFVQTFIHKVTQFHNGTIVRLNDGTVAEIVFTSRENPTRPMVNVNGSIINLAVERNKFIQNVISN